MAVLFCNIGWMEHYQGINNTDQIVGGGSYVKKEGMGHEVCNFADFNGLLYGYVQPPRHTNAEDYEGQINIDRLGAQGSESVDDILVIWTATRPEGGTVVVGWYKTATVFRFYQHFKRTPVLHDRNGLHGYRIIANASEATLLPIDQRTFFIPRLVKGGMGRSNIWFAAAPESAETVRKVRALVAGKIPLQVSLKSRKTDPDHNAKVEKISISIVRKQYEHNGYEVESVEKDNVGWDLEATSGKIKLRIEVKGLSGSIASAQLSPNEYDAFSEKSADYRLAIVTYALVLPKLIICRYSPEKKDWIVDGDEDVVIEINTRKSATILIHS